MIVCSESVVKSYSLRSNISVSVLFGADETAKDLRFRIQSSTKRSSSGAPKFEDLRILTMNLRLTSDKNY